MDDVTVQFTANVDGWQRGDVATVSLTEFVQSWVDRGWVRVVSRRASAPAPVDEAPAGNASKKKWREFLEGRGVDIPEGATRADMIELWDAANE